MSEAPYVLEIPDLAGDGWHLRAWRPDDAPSLSRAWHDPAVIAGSLPPPDPSEAVARRWIEGCETRRLTGTAFDVVIAGPGDEVLGEIGLSRIDARRRRAAMGWWLHEEARGHGIAGAAVTAFVAWALDGAGLDALVAAIESPNEPSVAVARAAGFVRVDDPRNPQQTARGTGPRVWYVANSTVK